MFFQSLLPCVKGLCAIFENMRSILALFTAIWCLSGMGIAQQWDSLQGGVNATIYTLALDVSNNTLYAGGSFTEASGAVANHLAKWAGGFWTGYEADGDVYSLKVYDNTAYAGGAFTTIDGKQVNGIARNSGGSWEALGAGVDGKVHSIVIHDNKLAAGGEFTRAGVVAAANLALWNGSNWQGLGSGLNGPVRSLLSFNDNLLVAGDFTMAGNVPVEGIAMWDGVQWQALPGADFNDGAVIHTMELWYGRVYIGGCFDSVAGMPATNLVLFDGFSWFALPNAPDDCVLSIQGLEDLYIGGTFSQPAEKLARWDGAQWQNIPGTFNDSIMALSGTSHQLFVGGSFSEIDIGNSGMPVNHIARLDFATGIQSIALTKGLRLFPNPAATQVQVATPPTLTNFTLLLTDISGRPVLYHEVTQPGIAEFSVAHLPNGIYLLHLQEEDMRQAVGRLVIAR